MSKILQAAAFASVKHRTQRRSGAGDVPYINHSLAVAAILESVGIQDPLILQAALLHDTLEDTDTTVAELRQHFGVVVTGYVEEVTDNPALKGLERKADQVLRAPQFSVGASLVKLADKIGNLRDILESPPAWSQSKKQHYFEWAGTVVAALPLYPELADLRESFHREYVRRAEI